MQHEEHAAHTVEFVTAMVGGQLFGIPILRVQDVFIPDRLTRVPLSPPEIAGMLNLRGRIITIIDLRAQMRLEQPTEDAERMAIGVEQRGESYGLLVDSVGEVLKLPADARETNPVNLDPRLAALSAGIHRLDGQLLVLLDIDRVLEVNKVAAAA